MNMKKIFATLLGVAFFIGIINLLGYVQHDHLDLECVYAHDNVVGFERNGNIYEWECDSSYYVVGNYYRVTMFDFENSDPTDDIIDSVKITLD